MRIDTTKRISQRDLDTAVGVFTDPYYSFHADQTVEETLLILQSMKMEKRAEYFYITDRTNVLLGFVTVTDLLYAPPETLLSEIVDRDVIKVFEDQSLEKGLQLLSQHQLLIVPVVNRENRLIGVLEIIANGSRFPATKKIHYKYLKEDIFQFIGFSIEHRKWNSPFTDYRLRMPWLLCNLAGGLICALIADYFKLTLEQFVVLSFFIPLVLTLSESISIQSMTLSLRFMHLRKIQFKQVLKRFFVETKSSFMIGLTSAILVGVFYLFLKVEMKPMLGIGLSIVIAMMVSAMVGALLPIVLHVFKLDPKVAAGPVVLMVADVLTIAIYFSLNTALLR